MLVVCCGLLWCGGVCLLSLLVSAIIVKRFELVLKTLLLFSYNCVII